MPAYAEAGRTARITLNAIAPIANPIRMAWSSDFNRLSPSIAPLFSRFVPARAGRRRRGWTSSGGARTSLGRDASDRRLLDMYATDNW
jgi:hypothetical protein